MTTPADASAEGGGVAGQNGGRPGDHSPHLVSTLIADYQLVMMLVDGPDDERASALRAEMVRLAGVNADPDDSVVIHTMNQLGGHMPPEDALEMFKAACGQLEEVPPSAPVVLHPVSSEELDRGAALSSQITRQRREIADTTRQALRAAMSGLCYDDGETWDPTAPRWLDAVGVDAWSGVDGAARPLMPPGRAVPPQGINVLGLYVTTCVRTSVCVPPQRGLEDPDAPGTWGGPPALYLIVAAPKGGSKSRVMKRAGQLVGFTGTGEHGKAWSPSQIRSPAQFTAPPSGSGWIRHMTVLNNSYGEDPERLKAKMAKNATIPDDADEYVEEPPIFHRPCCLFQADEGEYLESWSGKSGADLLTVVRTSFVGTDLGVPASEQARRIDPIPSGSYNASLIALFQTDIASTQEHLFGNLASARGTLDRMLFTTPVVSENDQPRNRFPNPFITDAEVTTPGREEPGSIDPAICDEIAARSGAAPDDLPAWWDRQDHGEHTDWVRLKLAAAIAYTDALARTHVSGDDLADAAIDRNGWTVNRARWDAAGVILHASKRVFDVLVSSSRAAISRSQADTAERSAATSAAVANVRAEEVQRRLKMLGARIARRVWRSESGSMSKRKAGLGTESSDVRKWFMANLPHMMEEGRLRDEAVNVAVSEGWLVVSEERSSGEDEEVQRRQILSKGPVAPPESHSGKSF